MTLAESPAKTVDLPKSFAHQERAHAVIPGAAHTYAKGDDQYAHGLAPVIVRGQGCRVWDLDGREYIEYGAGVRAVTLGHGYKRVCEAAQRELWNGVNFARPAAIELEAAEIFLDMIPAAEMVKFAKNGSDATTAAVKLARAITGKNKIAVCEDQPFFSIDDWFIGMTATDAGIPQSTKADSVPFKFNDFADLRRLFDEHADDLACVIMEAERDEVPMHGYLQGVRKMCTKYNVLLIIDETISGFRLHPGGAQTLHGVEPDLSTFGKGIANGFSVSAMGGKRQFMERGGLTTEEEKVFLLSTTHGGETHCLAAAIETMKEIREAGVCERLVEAGNLLSGLINDAAKAEGVYDHFHVLGHPSNLIYVTKDADGQRSQPFRTLFLQESVRRGLIAPNLVVNFSHTNDDLRQTADAVAEILPLYKRALEDGVDNVLEGRPVKPVFRKFN